MAEPTNKKLYSRIKADVKADMKWPSAYASGVLQKKYKAAGGEYSGKPKKKLSEAIKNITES